MGKTKKAVSLKLVIILVLVSVFGCMGAVTTAAQDNKLVAHYKFDGDFKDATGNGNDGTQVGDISFTDSVNGKGARFEGGYIEVNHNDLLNLENGFTFSVWIYKEHTREQLTQPILVKTDAEKTVHTDAYYFYNEQDRPGVSVWMSNGLKSQGAKQFIDIQKWSLCTVTADKQGIKFYIDGKLVESVNKAVGFIKSTGRLFIGYKETAFGNKLFKGVMDDLKIFNYAMTPTDVKKEYDSIANGIGKYVISRPQGLVAFYRFEGSVKDMSGYNNHGTEIEADGGLTYVTGIAGSALKFDGASYIEVNDSDTLDMDKGFTCSVWLKIDSYKKSGVNYQPIIDKLDGNTFLWKERSGFKALLGFDDKIIFESHRGGSSADALSTGITSLRPLNRWYMLTITTNGTNTKFYIDGVLKETVNKPNAIYHSMGKLIIGQTTHGFSPFFYMGLMDELRLYNYELSAKDVQTLYGLKDKLTVTSSNTILKKNQSEKLKTMLQRYMFTAPVPEAGTGSNIVVVKKGKDSYSKEENVTTKAKYSTSNDKVIKVNNGVVTAVGKGTATVTASYGSGPQASIEFTVT